MSVFVFLVKCQGRIREEKMELVASCVFWTTLYPVEFRLYMTITHIDMVLSVVLQAALLYI